MQPHIPSKTPERLLRTSKDSVSYEMKQGMGRIRNIMDFGSSDVKTSSLLAFQELGSSKQNQEDQIQKLQKENMETEKINSRYGSHQPVDDMIPNNEDIFYQQNSGTK
jgi:hypothetical protein